MHFLASLSSLSISLTIGFPGLLNGFTPRSPGEEEASFHTFEAKAEGIYCLTFHVQSAFVQVRQRFQLLVLFDGVAVLSDVRPMLEHLDQIKGRVRVVLGEDGDEPG